MHVGRGVVVLVVKVKGLICVWVVIYGVGKFLWGCFGVPEFVV